MLFRSFLLGVPLSGVVGAPISGLILDHADGKLGLSGWQWMFLSEGIPTILCGLVVMRVLTDQPKDAPWLDAEERAWLQGSIDAENAAKLKAYGKQSPFALIANPAILLLGLCYAMTGFGTNGIAFFLPQIISEAGFQSNTVVGLLTAIPLLAGAISMMIVSQIADRRREYRWIAVIAFTASGIGFLLASLFLNSPVIALTGLALASAGIWSTLPLLLAMPMQILSGAAVATGIAILNALGNIGPLFGPVITGIARDESGNYALPLAIFSGVIFMAAISMAMNNSYQKSVNHNK